MTACVALTPDGTRCQRPAIGIDYARGEPVCAEHLEAALDREEAGKGWVVTPESLNGLFARCWAQLHVLPRNMVCRPCLETYLRQMDRITLNGDDCPACPPAGAPYQGELVSDAQEETR